MQAQIRLNQAAQSITSVVASARDERKQTHWLMMMAGAGAVLGIFLTATVPGVIARALPECWLVPERMAAKVMERDAWDAGVRLLQVADPTRETLILKRASIGEKGQSALTKCREGAALSPKAVPCQLELKVWQTEHPRDDLRR